MPPRVTRSDFLPVTADAARCLLRIGELRIPAEAGIQAPAIAGVTDNSGVPQRFI